MPGDTPEHDQAPARIRRVGVPRSTPLTVEVTDLLGELADSIDRQRGRSTARSALDVLVPPVAPEADEPDALSALLPTAAPGVGSGLTPAQERLVIRYARTVARRGAAKREYDTLGPDVEKMREELFEMKAELGFARDEWPVVVDLDRAEEISPHERSQIHPKYRTSTITEQQYEPVDVVRALRELEREELIGEVPERYAYPKAVRTWVKEWRVRAGENGVRDEQGRYVDAFGEVLEGADAEDPTADLLALPRPLRQVVEPVELPEIRLGRRTLTPEEVVAHREARERAEHERAALDAEAAEAAGVAAPENAGGHPTEPDDDARA
jgi:hypothetical protein